MVGKRRLEEAASSLRVNKWVISRARRRYNEAVQRGSFPGARTVEEEG